MNRQRKALDECIVNRKVRSGARMETDRGRSRPPGYRPGSTRDLDEYEYGPGPRRSRPPLPPPRQRQRRVWPILLAGCGLGVVLTALAAAVVVFLAFRS